MMIDHMSENVSGFWTEHRLAVFLLVLFLKEGASPLDVPGVSLCCWFTNVLLLTFFFKKEKGICLYLT